MTESANVLLINRAIITEGNAVLVLQRAQSDSYNPGLWEFPGGKVDAGEEMEAGIVREVLEETGLRIELVPPIVHLESEIAISPKYRGRLYVALFHAARVLEGELILSHEHGAGKWLHPAVALERELTIESRRALMAIISAGRLG